MRSYTKAHTRLRSSWWAALASSCLWCSDCIYTGTITTAKPIVLMVAFATLQPEHDGGQHLGSSPPLPEKKLIKNTWL